MKPLTDQQRLFLVESTQLYAPWVAAIHHAESFKYGMKWMTVREKDYLYRLTDAKGNGKSLGPRSIATEALFTEFTEARIRAKDRLASLDERIKSQARLNKAVFLGRLPTIVGDILHALHVSKAHNDFRMVGTHAIYAYEAMAGVQLNMDLLATGDVDLLYDSRKSLSLVSKNLEGNGLLGLLQKIDKSFEISEKETFRAINKTGFMVDLITPARDMRDNEILKFSENDLEAVEVPNLHWLANAPCHDVVNISSNGMPVNARVPDPRAFVIHKAWLSQQKDRNPVKKPRDFSQSQMVFKLITDFLPQHPFKQNQMRYFPKAVFSEFFKHA